MTTPEQKRVQLLQEQADAATKMLDSQQQHCQHEWGAVVYKPDYREGYYIPSDKEQGRQMGVDSQPGCYVSAKTTPKWKKTCSKCGVTLVTGSTKKQSISSGVPGCGGCQNVPDFTHARTERL